MPDTPTTYSPAEDRYDARPEGWFRRAGKSGLLLPAVSLGFWHNFGRPGSDSRKSPDEATMHANATAIVRTAFDAGITHLDFANNYGPPPGSAETRVGRILKDDFAGHRDEMIISTKAGWPMWPGPYGEKTSRKSLLASLDQSLQRLGLDYVDVYYAHRPDYDCPLEETLGALEQAVTSGKALYTAVSGFPATMTQRAVDVAAARGFQKPVLHQPRYNMFDRWIEEGTAPGDSLIEVAGQAGVGLIPFSALDQGMLTDKYLDGIPDDSRAANSAGELAADAVTADKVAQAKQLQGIAKERGQSLPQLALAWALRDPRIASCIIGASRPEQVTDCCGCLDAGPLDAETLDRIESILAG